MLKPELRAIIREHYRDTFQSKPFVPGKDPVRYAGRVFDDTEICALVEASLDFWLTEGRFAEQFADKLSDFLDGSDILLTNSGSSANLLALSALTSKRLGDRRLRPGDEVITVAAGFPATVTPIVQNRCIPVFVDVDIATANIDVRGLEAARSDRTRCVFIAHTLGNPFDLDATVDFCRRHGLWLIEDNCDALGSMYRGRPTGTFGDISTMSFYPAHHITTGEGGAVATKNPELSRIVRSFRDWGRDCYCNPGENNTCGKRFSQQFGSLPPGYDHKYVYSEIGYNLKMTDLQAAIGGVQMDRLSDFCEQRRANFRRYREIFGPFDRYFIPPVATEGADPAWFSYIVTVRDDAPFTRNALLNHLGAARIETRNLFAGNMTRQPFFEEVPHRVSGSLDSTDFVMNQTFFLGTYPGMTAAMLHWVDETLRAFMMRF